MKSHFGMGVLLEICCIFSEHLFLRTPLDGCFCKYGSYILIPNKLAGKFLIDLFQSNLTFLDLPKTLKKPLGSKKTFGLKCVKQIPLKISFGQTKWWNTNDMTKIINYDYILNQNLIVKLNLTVNIFRFSGTIIGKLLEILQLVKKGIIFVARNLQLLM